MSHPLTWRMQDLWPIVPPAISGVMETSWGADTSSIFICSLLWTSVVNYFIIQYICVWLFFLFFVLQEWKCGVFPSSLSCSVLSKPCASCWRLLPTVTNLPHLTHVTFKPAAIPSQSWHWMWGLVLFDLKLCRCEQCEYESKVYVDGQMFPSRRDPCLRCYCSVSSWLCELHVTGFGENSWC